MGSGNSLCKVVSSTMAARAPVAAVSALIAAVVSFGSFWITCFAVSTLFDMYIVETRLSVPINAAAVRLCSRMPCRKSIRIDSKI